MCRSHGSPQDHRQQEGGAAGRPGKFRRQHKHSATIGLSAHHASSAARASLCKLSGNEAHCGKAHAKWLRMDGTQVDGLLPAITSAPCSAITTEVAELAMPAMPDEIERIAQGIGIELRLGLGRVTLNNKSPGNPGRFTRAAALLTLSLPPPAPSTPGSRCSHDSRTCRTRG